MDVREIVATARKVTEGKNSNLEFVRLRNGYRIFNALRGMEYVVDLEYTEQSTEAIITKRVKVCRPIHHTQLVPNVRLPLNLKLNYAINLSLGSICKRGH